MRCHTLLATAAFVLASYAPAAYAQQVQKDTVPATVPTATTSLPQTTEPQATDQPAPVAASTPVGEPTVAASLPEPSADDPAAQISDPAFVAAVAAAVPLEPAAYATQPFHLRLHNLHTLEDIDIVYRVGDNYQPAAIARLNYFLRDHYTNDVITYDPHEFDLLHDILSRLGRQGTTIDVVCGYRTSETNERLRSESRGVAEHSQHILGHAIDIRIPGSSTARIRNAALSLHEGGVGYYPTTRFVHVDVGSIRTWTFAPRRYHHRGRLRHAANHHRRTARRHRHITSADGL